MKYPKPSNLIWGGGTNKTGNIWNARILVFACSLVRAIHHELLTDQYMERYIKYIKHFIRLRESFFNIYADNAKVFQAEQNYVSVNIFLERI